MSNKFIEREDLTPETVLTVKDASRLTRLSVPAFYTERNKQLLGFNEKQGDGVWLIKVDDLVKHGFLTSDYEPTKSERKFGDFTKSNEEVENLSREVEALTAEIASLRQQLADELKEKQAVQLLADERAKQIEMIDALLIASGLKKD